MAEEQAMRADCAGHFSDLRTGLADTKERLTVIDQDLKKLTGNGHRGLIADLTAGQAEQKALLEALQTSINELRTDQRTTSGRVFDITAKLAGVAALIGVIWTLVS